MKNGSILKAALLLALAVVLLGLPFAAQAATADTYYIDESGTRQNVTATKLDGTETQLPAGVYVVEGATSFANPVVLAGDATLILADGCDMKLESWEGLNDQAAGYKLTLYGQEKQTGKISQSQSGNSSNCMVVSHITINGGTIAAKDSRIEGSDVKVNAGNIACKTLSGQNACAINGGTIEVYQINSNGSLEFSGGNVKADSIRASGATAIKGGNVEGPVDAENVVVSGGVFTGEISAMQDITVSGGQVDASNPSGNGLTAGGTITLGLSDRKEFIQSSGYQAQEVKVANSKELTDGTAIYTGTLTSAQITAIAGAKLVASGLPPEAVQIVTPPEASAITVGQPLSQSTLTGGAAKSGDTDVAGTFEWVSPDTVPAISDSQSTEYEVTFKPTDATYAQATCKVKVTVNKLVPTVNPPFAIEGLTYTGKAQALLTAGSAEGGEMQYALGDASAATEAYSTNLPTGTEVGTYYAWWRVVGDTTHADVAPDVFKVAIAEAPPEPEPEPQPEPEPEPEPEPQPQPVPDLRIVPGNKRTLRLKESIQLSVACKDPALSPNNAKWASSNYKILTVSTNSGLVTAKNAGTATVTATLGGLTASAEFTVVDPQAAADLRFADDTPTVVCSKETLKLKPYVILEPDSAKPRFSWKTSNKNVAKVNNSGIVTGQGTGEATITVSQKMNGVTRSASINITVLDSSALTFADDTPTVLYNEQKLNLNPYLVIDPRLANRKFRWKSSNKKIASVNSNGLVGASRKNAGKVTITATAETSGVSASIEIEVRSGYVDTPTSVTIINPLGDVPLKRDETVQLQVVFEPENVSQIAWKWKSSNAKIASVDSKIPGLIKGKGAGTATISLMLKIKTIASIDIRVVDPYEPETASFIDGAPAVLNVGQTMLYPLYVSVTPETAAGSVRWRSSNSGVVGIESATGFATAKKTGKTTLAVTKKVTGGKEVQIASLNVTVVDNTIPTDAWFADDTPVTVKKGVSFNLTPYLVLAPETADTKLTWKSSNSKVVKVNSGGLAQCLGTGTAEITVTTKKGNLTRRIEITVVE